MIKTKLKTDMALLDGENDAVQKTEPVDTSANTDVSDEELALKQEEARLKEEKSKLYAAYMSIADSELNSNKRAAKDKKNKTINEAWREYLAAADPYGSAAEAYRDKGYSYSGGAELARGKAASGEYTATRQSAESDYAVLIDKAQNAYNKSALGIKQKELAQSTSELNEKTSAIEKEKLAEEKARQETEKATAAAEKEQQSVVESQQKAAAAIKERLALGTLSLEEAYALAEIKKIPEEYTADFEKYYQSSKENAKASVYDVVASPEKYVGQTVNGTYIKDYSEALNYAFENARVLYANGKIEQEVLDKAYVTLRSYEIRNLSTIGQYKKYINARLSDRSYSVSGKAYDVIMNNSFASGKSVIEADTTTRTFSGHTMTIEYKDKIYNYDLIRFPHEVTINLGEGDIGFDGDRLLIKYNGKPYRLVASSDEPYAIDDLFRTAIYDALKKGNYFYAE